MSGRRKQNPEKEPIKANCRRFNTAIDILKEKYRFDRDIIAIIKNSLSINDKTPVSESSFNAYKNVIDNARYATIDNRVYKKYFEIIDRIIQKEFNKEWNETSKKYEIITKANKAPVVDYTKLVGLVGTWLGYSWNKHRDEINIFKLNIQTINNLNFNFEKINYDDCKVRPIGLNKIAFELITEKRCGYIIGILGSRDDLSNLEGFNFSYTDSGDDEVKCGAGFMVRVPLQKFNECSPESLPFSELILRDIEQKYINELKQLIGSQNIVHIFD